MTTGEADGPPDARGRRISGSVLACEAAGPDGPPDARGRPAMIRRRARARRGVTFYAKDTDL